jgi:hypothetical protein
MIRDQTLRATVSAAAAALSFLACGGNQPGHAAVSAPTAPTQVPSTTAAAAQSGWSIVATLVGGTGPVECASGPRIGTTASFEFGVERSSDSIRLIIDPRNFPTDYWADYEGTLSDDSFTASGHYYGMDLCGGGNVDNLVNYGVPASVTGTFSEDGRMLIAKEIRTSTFAERTFTYEYDWKAVLK